VGDQSERANDILVEGAVWLLVLFSGRRVGSAVVSVLLEVLLTGTTEMEAAVTPWKRLLPVSRAIIC
jgi:hypothetical protein